MQEPSLRQQASADVLWMYQVKISSLTW
jgi:hypothetical protein